MPIGVAPELSCTAAQTFSQKSAPHFQEQPGQQASRPLRMSRVGRHSQATLGQSLGRANEFDIVSRAQLSKRASAIGSEWRPARGPAPNLVVYFSL